MLVEGLVKMDNQSSYHENMTFSQEVYSQNSVYLHEG